MAHRMSWFPWRRPAPPTPPRPPRPPRPRQLHPVPWQEIHADRGIERPSAVDDGVHEVSPEGQARASTQRRREGLPGDGRRAEVSSRTGRPVGDVPAAPVVGDGKARQRPGAEPGLRTTREVGSPAETIATAGHRAAIVGSALPVADGGEPVSEPGVGPGRAGTPAEIIAAAGRDAANAGDAFATHSKKRLDELLGLPLGERFGHLDDQALTPADRTTLRRSMMARLKHRPGAQLREWGARRRRGARLLVRRALLRPALWLILVLGGAWFALAWSHTPTIAYSTVAQMTSLYGPQGLVTSSYSFPPMTSIPIVRMTDERALVRVWSTGEGFVYGTLERRGLVLVR